MAEVKNEVKPDPKDFYGDGGTQKRRHKISAPGVVVNGKALIGMCDLTYNQAASAQADLSNRISHELIQRLGKKDAEIVIGLGAAARATELF